LTREKARAPQGALRAQGWRAAGITLLGGLGVAAIMASGFTGPEHIAPAHAIAAGVAMAIVLPLAALLAQRTKDE
jgi:hypothetical protein